MRLEQLEQGAFTSHSIKGLKRIVSVYPTACHLSNANQRQLEARGGGSNNEDEEVVKRRKKEFCITSPVVFDRLMAVCLTRCHGEFRFHLLAPEKKKDDGGSKREDEESSGSSDDEEDEMPEFDENRPIHPKEHWVDA